jgi:hypothetical protein
MTPVSEWHPRDILLLRASNLRLLLQKLMRIEVPEQGERFLGHPGPLVNQAQRLDAIVRTEISERKLKRTTIGRVQIAVALADDALAAII